MTLQELTQKPIVTILLAMILSAASADSIAGVLNKMTKMFEKSIEVQIAVVDEQQRPVPYATLWFTYANQDHPDLSLADMQRLIGRYAIDYDLVPAGTLKPISDVLIYYTDAHGSYRKSLKENAYRGLSAMPVIIGALKRGYQPVAYARTMKVGSKVDVVLQLKKINSQPFDPRLLELDEIRSEVGQVIPEWTTEDRATYVDRMNERLLRLAQTFEQEGLRDEAAIAYYNLANLPSIDRIVGHDGKPQIVGYTRSYDAKSPQRKANHDKAMALGSALPLLHCEALIDRFVAQGGSVWADPSKTALRRQFVAEFEACLKVADERVFPNMLRFLSRAYSAIGEHRQACETMQRVYRFEPREFSAKDWPDLFEAVGRHAKRDREKTISDFVCEIPKEQ